MAKYELEGKNALVTGGSKGIGFGIAKALLYEAANVMILSRDKKKLDSALKKLSSNSPGKVIIFEGDVGNKKIAEQVLEEIEEKFGSCDILVNNSGGPPMGSLFDHKVDSWEDAFSQNLMSVINFTKVFSLPMKERNWGRIINITSSLAKEPTPQMVLSATMRSGVSAFSKAVSTELAPFGITVNTVCPGGVLTDRLNELVKSAAKNQNKDYDTLLSENVKTIPIGRFATPEEFADIIVFLTSERAKYLTGLSLMADGGLTKSTF